MESTCDSTRSLSISRRHSLARVDFGLGVARAGASVRERRVCPGGGRRQRRRGRDGGLQPAAFRAEGEARHLSVPVRRAVAPGSVRLQAAADEGQRHRSARFDPAGSAADRHDLGAGRLSGRAVDVQVRAARPVGRLGERAAAAHGADRRRHLLHQVDAHRADQPRSGDHLHPDRVAARRPAEHRRVGDLRPGQREPGSAGVRRDDFAAAAAEAISRSTIASGAPASCRASIRA